MLGSMSELFDAAEKLLKEAGARKVLVVAADGEVLAHAGGLGQLDDAAADALAQLVADVMQPTGNQPPEDLVSPLPGPLTACGTSVGNKAALLVLFDDTAPLDRVKAKMRRARDLLVKSLPTGETKTPAS
jgi:hypothetical protein